MNKTKWFVLIVIAVVVAGIGYLVFYPEANETPPVLGTDTETTDTSTSTPETTNPEVVTPTPTPEKPAAEPEAPGQYVDYSESLLADATLGKKVLFFHAPWCPQCRELDASIRAGTIPNDVTIIKVDYDSHQSLRSRYGVTIQTTLVRIDDNGDLVEKYVAYDEPSLASLVENLL